MTSTQEFARRVDAYNKQQQEKGRTMPTNTPSYTYKDSPQCGKVLSFPSLLVAFDIDHPTRYYASPESRQRALPGIIGLANKWADDHDLGKYWIYQTGGGWHILFEKPCPTADKWIDCYNTARHQEGWHQCGGHWDIVKTKGRATLRVGLKNRPGTTARRPPDISLIHGKVDRQSPAHVKVHHQALAQYQNYSAYNDDWLQGDGDCPIPLKGGIQC
jgi:hypothetical protein